MGKLLVIVLLAAAFPVRADDVYHIIIQKQQKKAENRWSLSQWLETRDRMRLMDLWLALHSPSPYEFYIGGDYQFGKSDASVGFNSNSGRLYVAGYASLFGLEAQSQLRLSEWTALFHFRFFGLHAQATNLTLQGGLRSRRDPLTHLNPLAGISLTAYISKYFGIEGLFRLYFPSLRNDSGIDEDGTRVEVGAFIDFQFVRVYGQYFHESLNRIAGPAATEGTRDGWAFGTKVFF